MRRPAVRLAAVIVVGLLTACSGGGEPVAAPTGSLTGRPLSEPAVTPDASEATAAPSPSATPSPSGTREPTDADRARFVAGYRPGGTSDLRDVAVDLDADGLKEVVFAYVVDAETRTQVDVAVWDGRTYAVVEQVPGGPADDLTDLVIRDINADGVTEVVTLQAVGASGMSLTVWAVADTGGQLAALNAQGDCFDGRNTYGHTGAELTDRDDDGSDEIRATCQDDDLPAPLWPEVVYVWQDGAYRCDHRERRDAPDAPCRDGGGSGAG